MTCGRVNPLEFTLGCCVALLGVLENSGVLCGTPRRFLADAKA